MEFTGRFTNIYVGLILPFLINVSYLVVFYFLFCIGLLFIRMMTDLSQKRVGDLAPLLGSPWKSRQEALIRRDS